jgi:hypothetical protein
VTVRGFSDSHILLFDVTSPEKPKFIEAVTTDGVPGDYRVSLAPSSPDARYLAVTSGSGVSNAGARPYRSSNLSSSGNWADYVVIASAALKAAAKRLADYRRGQGLETMVVDLENIMDEFNYGISSPRAINDFLRYAYKNWGKRPKYVVLAGKGTYDYKDNMGYGDNLIPPLIGETPLGLAPSDNLLADTDADHMPEMAIGRLPVLTADELRDVTDKIISYEANTGSRVIMTADKPDDGGDFVGSSNEMSALVPPQYEVVKIYLSDYRIDDARQLLMENVSRGAFLLNYFGHAGVDRLSRDGLLLSGDVSSMTSSGRLPVVSAMTCLVGQFALPGYSSLSETLLLQKGGGATAVWAPTGLAFDSLSRTLDEGFFRSAFIGKKAVLGDVILKALGSYRTSASPTYIMDIYTLQGDPALKMR